MVVVLFFILVTKWGYSDSAEAPELRVESVSCMPGTAVDTSFSGLPGVGRAVRTAERFLVEKSPAVSERLTELAVLGCAPAPVKILDTSRDIPDPQTFVKESPAETLPPVETTAEAAAVPDEQEYPAKIVPPVSDPADEGPADGGPLAVAGFLVDESGMICGIEDPTVISDGYLALPEEG